MKKNSKFQIFTFIIACLGVGFLSSYFSGNSVAVTYATLSKPFFAPPSSVFGPVWSILYILIGIAAYLVWKQKDEIDTTKAMRLFVAQLVLNFFWSIIFFRWHNIGLAFYEIVALLILVILTITAFHKISKKAAYLMIPYALWIAFATLLTYSIWINN